MKLFGLHPSLLWKIDMQQEWRRPRRA